MSERLDYAELRQFVESLGYSVEEPNMKEVRPVWHVSKYEEGDFWVSDKQQRIVYGHSLNHFLNKNMGCYWVRLAPHLQEFRVLAQLDDTANEELFMAIKYHALIIEDIEDYP